MIKSSVTIGLSVLVLSLANAGCSKDSTADPSVPPDDAIVVVGSTLGNCSMTPISDDLVDGVDVIVEHFVCETESSDPRVSGTEDLMVVTRVADYATGGTWTVQDSTLTNDQGVWRGTSQGIVDLVGVLPFAEGLWPYNYGEAHYVGEGAYEGLEYHYFFSGSNGKGGVAGWITSSD